MRQKARKGCFLKDTDLIKGLFIIFEIVWMIIKELIMLSCILCENSFYREKSLLFFKRQTEAPSVN